MRDSSNARATILDAAERIVVHEGVRQLTIERVAATAGLSRGGVLYHFPSKDALIEGMVTRLVEQFQQALDQAMANDAEPQGRFTRAYARLTLGKEMAEAQAIGAVMGGLIAGLAYNPSLLDPLNVRVQEWQQRSEAELDPATAAIVRLTTHALWTNEMFLTNKIDGTLRRRIVERLEQLTREAPGVTGEREGAI
jgi:AcrR family transcriptional regulator